jgi:hypothetical protein
LLVKIAHDGASSLFVDISVSWDHHPLATTLKDRVVASLRYQHELLARTTGRLGDLADQRPIASWQNRLVG